MVEIYQSAADEPQHSHGFRPGNPHRFGPDWPGKRCGARRKYDGQPCQAPALENGRCRMHGGKSTGPKTYDGRQAQRRASTTHGLTAGPDNPVLKERYGTTQPGPKWKGYQHTGPGKAALKQLKAIFGDT